MHDNKDITCMSRDRFGVVVVIYNDRPTLGLTVSLAFKNADH